MLYNEVWGQWMLPLRMKLGCVLAALGYAEMGNSQFSLQYHVLFTRCWNRYISSRQDSVICCHRYIFPLNSCALRILNFTKEGFSSCWHIISMRLHSHFMDLGDLAHWCYCKLQSFCKSWSNPCPDDHSSKSLNQTQETSISSEIFIFHYVHYLPPSFSSWGLPAQKWAKLESIWPELYSWKQCQLQSRRVTRRMRYKALLPRYIFNRMTSLPDPSVRVMLTDHIFHWNRPMEAAICQQVPEQIWNGFLQYSFSTGNKMGTG